jgi:Zinc-binding dehydrogenase
MKAAVIRRYGNPDVFQIEEVDLPLSKIAEAHAYSETERAVGKIVMAIAS